MYTGMYHSNMYLHVCSVYLCNRVMCVFASFFHIPAVPGYLGSRSQAIEEHLYMTYARHIRCESLNYICHNISQRYNETMPPETRNQTQNSNLHSQHIRYTTLYTSIATTMPANTRFTRLFILKAWFLYYCLSSSAAEESIIDRTEQAEADLRRHDTFRFLTEVPYLNITVTTDESNNLRGSVKTRAEVQGNITDSNSDLNVDDIIDPRVVGGYPAEDGSYPFMAAAIYRHRYFTCGASLVASNVVLLAAHCANSVHGVLIGRYNLAKYSADEEYFIIQEKLVNPNFTWGRPSKYDLVLMRFNEVSRHEPVRIADGTLVDSLQMNKEEVTILGWGQTASRQAAQTMKLQEGKLDLMTNDSCQDNWWGGYIHQSMICAYREGVSGCMGDSGGPLFYPDDDNDSGGHTLVGAVSWGSGRCNYATVFASISDQSEWIITNVNAWSKGEACYNYRSSSKCNSDPECVWEDTTTGCISASS